MHEEILIKKGDIYYADLMPVIGSEQGGKRPVLVIQNNIGNKHSSTVIVAVITSQQKAELPTHVILSKNTRLDYNSTVLLEQIRTIDKIRLRNFITHINREDMKKVESALLVSFGISKSQTDFLNFIHTPSVISYSNKF